MFLYLVYDALLTTIDEDALNFIESMLRTKYLSFCLPMYIRTFLRKI